MSVRLDSIKPKSTSRGILHLASFKNGLVKLSLTSPAIAGKKPWKDFRAANGTLVNSKTFSWCIFMVITFTRKKKKVFLNNKSHCLLPTIFIWISLDMGERALPRKLVVPSEQANGRLSMGTTFVISGTLPGGWGSCFFLELVLFLHTKRVN